MTVDEAVKIYETCKYLTNAFRSVNCNSKTYHYNLPLRLVYKQPNMTGSSIVEVDIRQIQHS